MVSFIGCLGEPKIYHDSVVFSRIAYFTWRVSDCEELEGVTITGDDGVGCGGNSTWSIK